ncbi:hypothetical protein B0H12DRAFT_1075723 [Mycena haematopus]|nr:hypothetical protein B0H12DRAFT_1075723 [Mycena haematopus]
MTKHFHVFKCATDQVNPTHAQPKRYRGYVCLSALLPFRDPRVMWAGRPTMRTGKRRRWKKKAMRGRGRTRSMAMKAPAGKAALGNEKNLEEHEWGAESVHVLSRAARWICASDVALGRPGGPDRPVPRRNDRRGEYGVVGTAGNEMRRTGVSCKRRALGYFGISPVSAKNRGDARIGCPARGKMNRSTADARVSSVHFGPCADDVPWPWECVEGGAAGNKTNQVGSGVRGRFVVTADFVSAEKLSI